ASDSRSIASSWPAIRRCSKVSRIPMITPTHHSSASGPSVAIRIIPAKGCVSKRLSATVLRRLGWAQPNNPQRKP
ncbi:MAG: hypothetical protein WBC62_06430, partial [Candidatus Macondimonas sp.]